MGKKALFIGVMLVGGLLLAACSSNVTPTPRTVEVTVEVPVEVTRQVEVPVTVPPAAEAPFMEKWLASAHADKTAEAFVHWNTEDPAEVPADCARCHSATGYQDFVGADGSPAGSVEAAAPIEDVIVCEACHNDATQVMSSVSFPSGAEITGLGASARCMQCHQGRASKVQVDESIEAAGVTGEDDTVSEDLGFTNIHYYAAAVSRYGTQVKGGYEYDGKSYDVLFEHVTGVTECADCHDSHSLEIKLDTCAACHSGVASTEDLRNVRMASSTVDYDGDGDVDEGIYFELEGVREALFAGMQAYATEVSGVGLVYSPDAYPYFFTDANSNGTLEEDEAVFDGKFAAWTPRLAKAAYNFQTSLKDPGAFAHGGKYIIQLMYDSLEDLNTQLGEPIDMSAMHRIDAGHFAGSEPAFRDWDAEGAVPATCAKCHSATGLPVFLANNAVVAQPVSNGLRCETCHDDLTTFTRYQVAEVRFPSGAVISFGEGQDSNLCINCHQGRESTVSVDNTVRGMDPDEQNEAIRFRNIHYFAAGATLFGDVAKGAYQYQGQTYLGQFDHGGMGPVDCVSCHNTHELVIQVSECESCHRDVETQEDLLAIRGPDQPDYDGDGDVEEGISGEIGTLHEALYAAIQSYAAETNAAPIIYDSHSYPYFFADTNGNGTPDPDEAVRENGYATWTPRLLKAAYNYQYVAKDPGGFAHNGKYLLQVLYDSLRDIGADVSAYTRPAAAE
jgi:hypothetical protein